MPKEVVTLGGGCFWCLEAVYSRMRGVESAISGYMGGRRSNPSYEEVCSGVTGHIEVVQVTFDSQVSNLREILDVFFTIHDPTTRDRQGNDIGSQYRSVIFYANDEQKRTAEETIAGLKSKFPLAIVTELRPLETFYPAEAYHQDYFTRNPRQSYCLFVVGPKVEKFRTQFQPLQKQS